MGWNRIDKTLARVSKQGGNKDEVREYEGEGEGIGPEEAVRRYRRRRQGRRRS